MFDNQDESMQGYNTEMFGEEDRPAPAPAQTQQNDLLTRQLAPGEILLWQGRPQTFHRETAGPCGLFFALFFLGFALVWMVMAMNIAGFSIFPLFGIPFVLVDMSLVFPNLFSGGRRKSTQYGITNQRVIEMSRGRVVTWPRDTIMSVEKRYFKDGTGDLILSNGQVRITHSNGHRHTHAVTLNLMGLPDVDAAEAALNSPMN